MKTIRDVAERANVSIATVSNAFNKPHLVKSETHERILQAARELNYNPNLFARGLAGGKSQMVGVLVADIRYPFTATVARGIEDVFRDEGYISIISSTDGETANTIRLMDQLYRRGVSCFIIVPSYFGIDEELLKAIKSMMQAGVSIIVAGYQFDDLAVEFVTYRPQAATKEAINYLIQLGHREIAYIGSQHSKGDAVARYLGYQESLLSNRIPLRPELVVETDVTPVQVREGMEKLLDLAQPPTAVFALNDVAAMSIIDVCRERNVRVPEDLSLISFDYVTLAQRVTPRITSVVIPTYEVGRKTAELLLNRQKNPDLPPQQLSMPYQFEIRQTSALPGNITN